MYRACFRVPTGTKESPIAGWKNPGTRDQGVCPAAPPGSSITGVELEPLWGPEKLPQVVRGKKRRPSAPRREERGAPQRAAKTLTVARRRNIWNIHGKKGGIFQRRRKEKGNGKTLPRGAERGGRHLRKGGLLETQTGPLGPRAPEPSHVPGGFRTLSAEKTLPVKHEARRRGPVCGLACHGKKSPRKLAASEKDFESAAMGKAPMNKSTLSAGRKGFQSAKKGRGLRERL